MTTLAETHDALLLDLDGTVYLGGVVIEHAADALAEATRLGSRSIFVTNNASRPPLEVATSLTAMGIAAGSDDVCTSPEAAAEMLASTHAVGEAVLVIGAQWLADAVAATGLRPVRTAAENPVAVVQGHSPDTGWKQLAEAAIALRAGVDWVACNTDSTLPTERGLLPGNGAMVAALVAATGLRPRVAGKPARPLLDTAVHRTGARSPMVVGDRLDTDIEAAVAAELPSLLVLTGVSTAADLLAAPESQRPTHVSLDLRGLVDPARVTAVGADSAETSGWVVQREDRKLVLQREQGSPRRDADGEVLDALRALVAVAWSGESAGDSSWSARAADTDAATALARLGLS